MMKKQIGDKFQNSRKFHRRGSSGINYPKEIKLKPFKLIDFNLIEKIYLGAILSSSQIEYFPFILFNNTEEQPVAPSQEFFSEIIYNLAKNKILIFPNPTATSFSELEYINKLIDLTKMSFFANIELSRKDEIVESILYPQINLKENCQQLIKIWKTINIEECKAYLNYCLKYVDFANTVSDRASLIFEKYVDYFSVSQIIGLLSRCLGYTTIEFQAGKITKINSGPYLLGTFVNQADKAIKMNWDLYKFSRPKDLPESYLTAFFFKRVLKLKNAYYDIIPSISELN